MVNVRLVDRPAFEVIGRETWISGPDNDLFGHFWEQCQAKGLFETFEKLGGLQPGPQTHGATLGISRVESDPAKREFYYLIAIEKPENCQESDLESYLVPASTWAVFECRGRLPEAIAASEIYAFTRWLPASGFIHALAPEMEVYPAGDNPNNDEHYCEFWLPVTKP